MPVKALESGYHRHFYASVYSLCMRSSGTLCIVMFTSFLTRKELVMPQPITFKLRQPQNRPHNNVGVLPEIDKKRATAVLVRQSKDGADTAQAESRETQLGLQDYGKLLYGDDEPDVRLYDEGSGVSGQKR